MCNFFLLTWTPTPPHQIFSFCYIPHSFYSLKVISWWKQVVRYCYDMCGRRQDKRCHKMSVQSVHFQGNWCLLFQPAHLFCLLPTKQRPPQNLLMSFCFILLSCFNSSGKTSVTHFYSIGSGESSKASEVQSQPTFENSSKSHTRHVYTE